MEKETLQFRIDAYTPDTLPMARLAEYLSQLSLLLGSRESVHFDKLLKGSAVVQMRIESTEAAPVISRIRSAPNADGPEDVKRAYARIDNMLRENKAVADIRRKGGAKILSFLGRKLPEIKSIVVSEHAEVDGVIVRVGGTDATIPVHLQASDGETFYCQVRNRDTARELAAMIYGAPIRVRGVGQWERSPQGVWKLLSMNIDAWEALDATDIHELFAKLRAMPSGWKEISDPEGELRRIREGK